MKKDLSVFLEHILESIELIESYTEGASEEKFVTSPQLSDGVRGVPCDLAVSVDSELSFIINLNCEEYKKPA